MSKVGLKRALGFTTDFDTFEYLVYKNTTNSKFEAKHDNWDLESSNSDALTVLQYAVNNADRKGAIGIKGGKGKWYNLTGSLSLVDKNVILVGLNNPGSISTTAVENNATDDYGGVVFKKNFATTAPLIDMRNTTFTKNSLKNISVVGNSTASDFGIRVADGREKQPLFSNVWVTGFDTGVELTKTWYTDFNQLNIYNCTTTGLVMTGTGQNACNTLKFFGGRISGSPINVDLQSTCNDTKFFGTIMEGLTTAYVSAVRMNANSNDNCFYGCSFEKNSETNPLIIDEAGNNNTYFNCRFDSDVNYTAIEVKSTARATNFIANYFQSNTAGVVATILLDAGSLNTNLMWNGKSTNTVGTVTLTDNSSGAYTAMGNTQMAIDDKVAAGLKFGTQLHRIKDVDANGLGIRNSADNGYKSLFADGVCIAALRDQAASTWAFLSGASMIVQDGKNMVLATTTGTKIGTGTTQKLGFWNATPIAQPAANADTSGATLAALETEVNEIKQLLRNVGFMAP